MGEYHEVSYWEGRYTLDQEPFEWYAAMLDLLSTDCTAPSIVVSHFAHSAPPPSPFAVCCDVVLRRAV